MKVLARCRPAGATMILDYVVVRNYTIRNLCALASFGRSAPPKYAFILCWQYCVIVDALGVFGWLVHSRIESQIVTRIWLCDLVFSIGTQNNNLCGLPNASDTLRLGLGTSVFQLAHGGVGRHTIVGQNTILGLYGDFSWARMNVPI